MVLKINFVYLNSYNFKFTLYGINYDLRCLFKYPAASPVLLPQPTSRSSGLGTAKEELLCVYRAFKRYDEIFLYNI